MAGKCAVKDISSSYALKPHDSNKSYHLDALKFCWITMDNDDYIIQKQSKSHEKS
jgi:hypothetical protein